MKGLLFFAFLGMTAEIAAGVGITVTVFSVTSKNMIVRWTRFPDATSYKVTVSPFSTPDDPTAFAQFGPNTVMGSVGPLSPNIVYEVKVEALANQVVLSTTFLESRTAPQTVDIDNVKAQDSSTLIVAFTPVGGATGYQLRVENAQGYFSEEAVASSPALIGSLQPYTTYSLSIMAINSAGRSQPSASVEARTLLPPPLVTTSSPTNDSIVVSWLPADGSVSYSVTSVPAEAYPNTTLLSQNTTTVTLTDLDAGTLHIIQVYGWDQEGRKGEASPYINQTTRPATPGLFTVTVERSPGQAWLNVSWEPVFQDRGAVEYTVNSSLDLQCTTTQLHCILEPIGCAEMHILHLVAANEAGPSTPTEPELFGTFPCPPQPVEVEESDPGNCTFSWESVELADGYQGFIKRNDGVEDVCNTTGNSCHFHCPCGFTYLTSVLAYNLAGDSEPGPVLNYTTMPCCPDHVTITAATTDTFEVTWAESRGADAYETHAVDGGVALVCNDSAPVCVLSDLRCDRPYTVTVTPCSEARGCNRACPAHLKDTPPCTPTDLSLAQGNGSSVTVSWAAENRDANYTVSAVGPRGRHTCWSDARSCEVDALTCGSSYNFIAVAHSAAGQSLPSYSVPLETAPCCPASLEVDPVTQAMSNVSWSHARGADSFVTTLTSPRGHASCHTRDPHCLMGCITCGTNYTVTMETYSRSGHMANCSYQGFSSSACCPSGIKLYRTAGSGLRVHWRPSSGGHNYTVEMTGSTNYTCSPLPGQSSCDLENIQCGNIYVLLVAPLAADGTRVEFCHQRLYLVTCSGYNLGMVIYRGKQFVD
ncbi:fibronectin type III domain-containing protein 7 [Gadus morhua]|uniref:fibronectin type III domain-containing protein 7 n=1 Tax=Gadus morhua TaxID=8049 RepID=UPI0011B55E67|nr:fibronectin type III domain-containing protein 7 [Gadus morhua]